MIQFLREIDKDMEKENSYFFHAHNIVMIRQVVEMLYSFPQIFGLIGLIADNPKKYEKSGIDSLFALHEFITYQYTPGNMRRKRNEYYEKIIAFHDEVLDYLGIKTHNENYCSQVFQAVLKELDYLFTHNYLSKEQEKNRKGGRKRQKRWKEINIFNPVDRGFNPMFEFYIRGGNEPSWYLQNPYMIEIDGMPENFIKSVMIELKNQWIEQNGLKMDHLDIETDENKDIQIIWKYDPSWLIFWTRNADEFTVQADLFEFDFKDFTDDKAAKSCRYRLSYIVTVFEEDDNIYYEKVYREDDKWIGILSQQHVNLLQFIPLDSKRPWRFCRSRFFFNTKTSLTILWEIPRNCQRKIWI